jgi:hypothetical protein
LWLTPAARGALWLLQGCDQKAKPVKQTQALAPPIVDTPPPKPATVSTADLPPPVVGPPQQTAPTTETDSNEPVPKHQEASRIIRKNRRQHDGANTTAAGSGSRVTPLRPLRQASARSVSFPVGPQAISENAGRESASTLRKKASIRDYPAAERFSESKTAAQIREFLKEARSKL